VRIAEMAAEQKFNQILQIVRALMYLAAGVAIIFLPIPLFKNGPVLKIILGVLFILYSGFRYYQIILQKKRQSKDHE
jgi:hypothetical protein